MARWVLLVLVLTGAACENSSRRLVLPTSPGPPVVFVPPPPVPFAPLEFTAIEIGEVVRSRIENPPECIDELGWPCRYFQLTAPSSGVLTVALTYSIQTNRSQGVDLTVRESDGRVYTWAQFFSQSETRVTAPIAAGKTYYITMWYTYAGLEFELKSSLQ